MKSYPSIPGTHVYGRDFYVFNKEDGTNIRAEWSEKKGFYKFGTRKQMIDASTPVWGVAIPLIQALEPEFRGCMAKKRIRSAVGFFELFGPSSFAGQHAPEEALQVVLFDLALDKRGIVEPRVFLELVEGRIPTPALLHRGKVGPAFVSQVVNSEIEGMAFEGVVCKSIDYKSPGLPFMWKIKTSRWLEKLRAHCGRDEKLFQELR